MDRPSRDEKCLEHARVEARQSTCLRRQVGSVIALDGRIISTGYGGAPSKLPHCTPETCNDQAPCTNTSHAEANAIAFAARHGLATEGATLYTTLSPCKTCADLIINAGITRVIYETPYRLTEGLERLTQAGIFHSRGGFRS